MTQLLMFPDPRPLVERLGREFFRSAPDRPGVYLMRDASDRVLYVGKAKNLRNRLGHYRVANPDRMPRRHLRLLSLVIRIELSECADEQVALARESELLLQLRPRFNRAGTWPKPRYFFGWSWEEDRLRISISDRLTSKTQHGPIAGARFLLSSLARLIWLTLRPGMGADRLPCGWLRGLRQQEFVLENASVAAEPWASLPDMLVESFSANPITLERWVRQHRGSSRQAYTEDLIGQDLEQATGILTRLTPRQGGAQDVRKEGLELRA